ncbi:MAG: efflux RND transporter periplasmic adaptor subunit [Caulobacterales bacterium]|nr:efflux RND transporter periplasmic adaptor subunit [Caulobacterales bacterium]
MRWIGLPCAALAALAACDDAPVAETAPPVRPAKLIAIAAEANIRSIRLPAVVAAADSSVLTFQVSGVMQELNVGEGDAVTRGQVIAQLDQRDFQTAVASAQATFDNAQIEFERTSTLVERGTAAQSMLDQRRSQRDVARASLDSARKALDDTVLRAPFEGVVADLHVENFETVTPQQAIVTIQGSGVAEAVVQVPATIVVNAEQIEPIELYVELDAAPNIQMNAVLSEAASLADPTTQTFEARFAFTPPDELVILPGMTGILRGQFRIAGDEASQSQIVAPISAILAEAGQTYVWLVDPEAMTVSRRDVVVSPGVGETVVIASGVAPGDLIVGAGGHYLREGAEIRPYEP